MKRGPVQQVVSRIFRKFCCGSIGSWLGLKRSVVWNWSANSGARYVFTFDPLGRRIHKSGTGVTNTWFLNDGDDEVVEYNSNKDVVAIYVPGPAIDEPIAMVTPNGNGTYSRKYFHTNHQGSVIAMSDDAGAKVEGPFTYGPYGSCFQGTTPCAQLASSVPYKFTGRRLDPETELYYDRARMYWSTGGRFLQTDPVGYTADLNLYTYAGNDPVGRTDPTGKVDAAMELYSACIQTGGSNCQNPYGSSEKYTIVTIGGHLMTVGGIGGGVSAARYKVYDSRGNVVESGTVSSEKHSVGVDASAGGDVTVSKSNDLPHLSSEDLYGAV